MPPTSRELVKLNRLHYLSASGNNKGKARAKAAKMGYSSESLKRGVAHWKHEDGHSVISVKGTDPKNMMDLTSDIHLAVGRLSGDAQLKHRRHDIKKIYSKTEGDKYLTGHSLGGSIASKVLADSPSIRRETTEAHLFNTGSTKAFSKELSKPLDKEAKQELKNKVVQHRVKTDLISNSGVALGKTKLYDQKDGVSSAHSLNNFD